MSSEKQPPLLLDTMEGEGSFLRKQIDIIKNSLNSEQYNHFCNISNDEARIKFVFNLDIERNLELPKSRFVKNSEKALNYKNQGNKLFGKDNFQQAAKLYSQALLECPSTEDILLSTLYANRSASFYHLKQYKNALHDIELCLTLPYPEYLQYKVWERTARCYLALNDLKRAVEAFKTAMPILQKSNLDFTNRQKKESDFSIMVALLTKTLNEGAPKKKRDSTKQTLPAIPKISGKINKKYNSASNLVKFESNLIEGRYATANSDIEPGEVILIENAHCANLLFEYSKTHCQNCFIRSPYLIPCPNCPNVVFCSVKCRNIGMVYHKFECNYLDALWTSGISIICTLAIRLITQKGLDYFLKIKSTLCEKINAESKYDPTNYVTVYNLCRHEDKRTHLDFFQRSVMAVILLKYLQSANFFKTEPNKQLTENELYIGTLLLRNLQILQFNAHEIAELQYHADFPGDIDKAKSQFIGGGLFPTLALFNHSCEPGIVRYFSGSQVIVRSVKPIPTGQIIAENYGPIYTEIPKETRKEELKSRYWFDCNCIPCKENWSIFDKMSTDVLSFRCLKSRTCPGVAKVSLNTDEFMFPCPVCSEQICIFGSLKGLNDTEAMFKRGERFMQNRLYQDALEVFLKIMKLLDNTLKPPYKDFCLCQQKIRSCMLTFGNVFQPFSSLTKNA